MGVSIFVGRQRFEIGSSAFLKAWFSTIYKRLEHEQWGSRFPVIMRRFYGGSLPHDQATAALAELRQIQKGLEELSPDLVVWDFENPLAQPPWGRNISPHIVSLGNYFVTSDGKDLFATLVKVFSEAKEKRTDVTIG